MSYALRVYYLLLCKDHLLIISHIEISISLELGLALGVLEGHHKVRYLWHLV